jgi:phosphoribosyl 1,2-cyclic phosphate phosphodiesterase
MTNRFTILGCGASGGVPRLGNEWGACDPENPKNRRLRCAALIEQTGPKGTTIVLVDSGPDIREQLLAVRAQRLDGVIFTHDHADHTHGIDDLRVLAYRMRRRIDIWADAATQESLTTRFGYCFETPEGRDYPPILTPHEIQHAQAFSVPGEGGAVDVLPVPQVHGGMKSLGFRIKDLAYSPDISDLPESSIEMFAGLDVWIVDALRYTSHPSHFSLKQALEWIERLAPKRAILTHLNVELDFEELRCQLPANVEPAYDGMVVEF